MVYIFLIILSIFFSAGCIFILLKIANRHKWYDIADNRKIHSGNIPRIGGVGILVSFFSVSVVFLLINALILKTENNEITTRLLSFFIFSFLISLIGLVDDFKNINAIKKLVGEIIIAFFVIGTGHYFKEFYIPLIGITINSVALGVVVTFFWIIGVTNAVNLIDGMDGLSSGLTVIPVIFFAYTAVLYGNYTDAGVLLSLSGAILGFLVFNFPPAKIFMGDGGSLFLGFLIAVIPLYFFQNEAFTGTLPILSISFVFIPIYDTLSAVIRRVRRGIPFFTPDNEHLHHIMLNLGFTTKQVLALLYLIAMSIMFPAQA